jgi:hypothetical protein
VKILMTTGSMGGLSGAPLYTYTTALELAKTHQVDILSNWEVTGSEGEHLRIGCEAAGVGCHSQLECTDYDVILAAHFAPQIGVPIVNLVHGILQFESPINAGAWVCDRPEVKRHIIEEHGVPEGQAFVIYNGVDRERFQPKPKPPRDYKLTVVPCTIDWLREKFLTHLCNLSSPTNRYEIYGDDMGQHINWTEWTTTHPAKFHIEENIATADAVAGILLGRVNLEANSCGVPSEFYHPETLERTNFLIPEAKFNKRHNVVNTAQQIMNIADFAIRMDKGRAR